MDSVKKSFCREELFSPRSSGKIARAFLKSLMPASSRSLLVSLHLLSVEKIISQTNMCRLFVEGFDLFEEYDSRAFCEVSVCERGDTAYIEK